MLKVACPLSPGKRQSCGVPPLNHACASTRREATRGLLLRGELSWQWGVTGRGRRGQGRGAHMDRGIRHSREATYGWWSQEDGTKGLARGWLWGLEEGGVAEGPPGFLRSCQFLR